MPEKRTCHWIGAGIGGAIATGVGWMMINGFWTVNGVGLLQRLGWPFSNVLVCVAAGATACVVGEMLRARRERQRTGQLADMARTMNLRFWDDATEQDLGEWRSLPVFQKWSGARNRMFGTVLGIPVEMVDYTYVVRGSDSDSSYDQTVALLPAAEEDLPAFDLQPRTLAVRMLNLVGAEGIVFSAEDVSAINAQVVERFHKNYHLSSGLEAETARLAGRQSPECEDAGAAIRRLFSLDVLAFFAEKPGWCVQGAGRRLAVWQTNKIVAPADRSHFLADAMAIRSALVDSAQGEGPPVLVPTKARSDPAAARAGLTGAMIGAFCGFFTGGILGGIAAGAIFFLLSDPRSDHFFLTFLLEAAVFFGGALGGLFLGMFLGRRIAKGRAEGSQSLRQD